MNITIDHIVLLDALTYDQLFDYVDVDIKFVEALERSWENHCQEMQSQGICFTHVMPFHIELQDTGQHRIWYPIGAWINEQKRRSGLELAISQAREKTISSKSVADQIRSLNEQLLKVLQTGNQEKINEVANQIRELQKKL